MEFQLTPWKRGASAATLWTPSETSWPRNFLAILVVLLSMMCGYALQSWVTRPACGQQSYTRIYKAFEHDALRAVSHWKRLMRRIIRVRWGQLVFYIYGIRLQTLSASFRSRLGRYIRPGP